MAELLENVKQRLSDKSGFEFELIINENSSNMLAVLDKRDKWAKLSLHKMFLEAPESVITAVATYVKKKDSSAFAVIRSYIHSNLPRFDYSHRLDARTLYTNGKVYHLQKVYDEINKKYFESKVKLWITWFDRLPKKNCSRIVFGQYFEALKLIKINKMLDDRSFPRYFIDYVVYHEILHHVVPSYIDEKGVARVHSKEFKERELIFKDYHRAKAWELEHRHQFFAEFN
ncbi:MAG: hypothetical protein P4L16_04285 [Chlamydiales bacterium]|nr:hypothetical protein [Chlamydiales bacterium]